MLGEVLLRSEFVLQHFGEVPHVLTRCCLEKRKARKTRVLCLSVIALCVGALPSSTRERRINVCRRPYSLLIKYLAKVFITPKWFLPRKQTTNYHNSLTRERENPFAEDSDNYLLDTHT